MKRLSVRRAMRVGLLCGVLAPAAVRAQSSSGRLEGTVTDSIHARPFAGATVHATWLGTERETTFTAVSDRRGRYSLDRLPAGSYAVGVASPLLDSLDYGGPPRRVTIAAARATKLELGTPSRATLQALACPGLSLPDGTGALIGSVTSTDADRPLAGAHVAVAWSELSIDTVAQQVTSGQRAARVATDDGGQYRLCGVPMGEWLLVQVQHAGRAGAVVRTSIGAAGVAVRDLSFSARSARPLGDTAFARGDSAAALPEGDAMLAGTALHVDGRPIAGAQVQVLGTAAATRTDEQGRFALVRLPAGTLELEVRQLGFAAVRRAVELRGGRTTNVEVRLERAVSLDSVRVVARRLKYAEFETHRRFSLWGKFLDEDQLARLRVSQTSDVLATLPGFWVIGTGPGARVVSNRTALLGSNCEVNVVVDHMPDQRINDVPASQVAAVETYPMGGGPLQYRQPCGLIMIWTKR